MPRAARGRRGSCGHHRAPRAARDEPRPVVRELTATSARISGTASRSESCCSLTSDFQVEKATACPSAAARVGRQGGGGQVASGHEGLTHRAPGRRGIRRSGGRPAARPTGVAEELVSIGSVRRRTRRARRVTSQASGGIVDRRPAARSGDGSGRQCAVQAPNSAASSGKWRYSVERRTPACSATALIDVRAGPRVPCNATALSVIRRRVSLLDLGTALHAVGALLLSVIGVSILTHGADAPIVRATHCPTK